MEMKRNAKGQFVSTKENITMRGFKGFATADSGRVNEFVEVEE
jgi:hypothetical protein